MNAYLASEEAEAAIRSRVADGLRRLGPDGRLRQALAMSAAMKRLAMQGLRERNPDWDADQLAVGWIALVHGKELADRYAAWLKERKREHA